VSKDAEFYVDFKNINLPLWQNAPKKKLFLKNMLNCDFSWISPIFLGPYIVNVPKWQIQLWSGHWVKTKFFFIFLTFGRDTTNCRGTLVENVKKVQIQPTLLYSRVAWNMKLEFRKQLFGNKSLVTVLNKRGRTVVTFESALWYSTYVSSMM
jgi:hypothetical protein